MVSGSDAHGTPITIRADQEGITPAEVVERYHAAFLDCWNQFGITFDLFTHTDTENHERVVHDIFRSLHDQGYIYTDNMLLAHCANCQRFLPDRYVEGTCPNCSYDRARGDQCDQCGHTLDPQELIQSRCILCGSGPEFRESEHFFLKLSAFQEPLLEWIRQKPRFLPDRYVEGTCPNCSYDRARGDQCDQCGHTLDPQELIQSRCILCGSGPEFRESEHFFLKLSAFQEPLLEWIRQKPHWRANVANQTRSFLEGGLKDRAITRDLTWGIPIPLEGYAGKRIYVWFEAVIGYLSAAIEWAENTGQTDKWQDFWKDPTTRSYYFIGKDNIPFHSIIWPAMIMGYGNGLNLPFDVPANEFLSLENRKFSTSQNWAVWLPDYLERYDPDPLRYLLSINMPESGDADFSWAEFVRRNNEELVATYGNLVNRVLSFTFRNFDGKIPEPGPLNQGHEQILLAARVAMDAVSESLYHTRFKAALGQAFALAQETNRYLDAQAPWRAIKTDRQEAATSLCVAIKVINCLKVVLAPFLPFSSQKVHEYLGFDGAIEGESWDFEPLVNAVQGGNRLRQPAPLYTKLDPLVVEAETQRLGIPVV